MYRNFNETFNHYLRTNIVYTYTIKETTDGIIVMEDVTAAMIKEMCNPILEFFGLIKHNPNKVYYRVKFKNKKEHEDNMEVVASIHTKCRLKQGIWLGVIYDT